MAAETVEAPVMHETLTVEKLVDHFPDLQEALGNRAIYLVRADTEVSGSFKWRGAENAISKLPFDTRHVVTVSAGNHGGGVSAAAAERGMDATVFAPASTPPEKVAKLHDTWRQHNGRPGGLQVVLHGADFDAAYEFGRQQYPDSPFIHPFDDADVIEGQGTLYYDIRAAIPNVSDIVLPVGGGGLLTGVNHEASDEVRVYGAEAWGSDSLRKSLVAGYVVEATNSNSKYGGSNVKRTGEAHVLPTLQQDGFSPDRLVTAPESEVMDLAMYYYRQGEQTGLQLEPTSLVAVAGLAKLVRQGVFSDDAVIAVVGTGHNESPVKWVAKQRANGRYASGHIGSR